MMSQAKRYNASNLTPQPRHELLRLLLLLALLFYPASQLLAATAQAVTQIQDTVQQFVAQQLKSAGTTDSHFEVGPLDPHLRLAPCTQTLQAFLPHGRSVRANTTVGVRCRGTKAWTLYVPVKISLYAQVLVANRALPGNTPIQSGDFMRQRRDIAMLHQGYLTRDSQVLGKITRRPLAAGSILHARVLRAPRLISRGDNVAIMVKNHKIEVRMEGQALMGGAVGEVIKVRNSLSKRIIQGEVIAKGVVRVN